LGALALDGAGIATLAALSGVLEYWWIGAALMGMSAVILGYAVWPRSLDVGPEPEPFHARFGGHTARSASSPPSLPLSHIITRL
jgi:hypothetical protein